MAQHILMDSEAGDPKVRLKGNEHGAAKVVLTDLDGNPYTAATGGGGSGADRELVVTTYSAKTAFTGASVGDTVTCTQVLDVSSTPGTVATIWRNQTAAADLVSAPSAANLTLIGADALSNLTSLSSTQGNGGDSPAVSDSATASQVAIAKRTNVLLSALQAQGTLTNRSGTITTGGTAQQLMASNANRKGFSVQNLSAGDLWFNALGTAAATQPSMKLVSGAYFETPAGYGATGAVSIFGATTGQAFTAREW